MDKEFLENERFFIKPAEFVVVENEKEIEKSEISTTKKSKDINMIISGIELNLKEL